MRIPSKRPATFNEDSILAISTDEVLEPHSELINRIKLCYGVDQATFERDLLSPIRRYAEFVHLLPATPNNYFRAPGGLLQLGLEVAFFSLQGTDGHIFSAGPRSRRGGSSSRAGATRRSSPAYAANSIAP